MESVRPIKILHIIDTLDVGGAEKLLVAVVNGMPQYEHHVFCLSGSDQLASQLESGTQFFNLHLQSKLGIPACVRRLRRYINEHDISIVHSHLIYASLIARLACPRSVKLFTTLHCPYATQGAFSDFKIRWADKLTYKKYHHLISVSKEVLESFDSEVGIKGDTDILINFVDDAYFTQPAKKETSSKDFRLVAVGNLKDVKNYDYVLEGFRSLPSSIQLDIYGDGPLKEQLQKKIDEYRLPVRLCGVNNALHQVLTEYDAYLMASLYEGCPLSLLEAMAAGLPLVLSDIASFHEIVGDDAEYFSLKDIHTLVDKIKLRAERRNEFNPTINANLAKVKGMASRKKYLEMLSAIYLNNYKKDIQTKK
jgi:glycosyltransferase involved in cell wall biosynthesis